MTDLDALLAAIIAHPAEDMPRLLYADELDASAGTVACDWCNGSGEDRPPNPVDLPDGRRMVYAGPLGPCPKCKGSCCQSDGRAERAEFIRVQCELARLILPSPPPSVANELCANVGSYSAPLWVRSEDLPKFKALRAREQHIPAHCLDAEVNQLVAWGMRPSWGRGFVESVTCTGQAWSDYGDAVLAEQPLRRVTFTDAGPEIDERTEHVVNEQWVHVANVAGQDVRASQSEVIGPPARSLDGVLLSKRWPSVPPEGWQFPA